MNNLASYFWIRFDKVESILPGLNEIQLSENEINQLIEEWEPEQLCKDLSDTQKQELITPVFTGTIGCKTKCTDGKERLNFASMNFLGLANSDVLKEKAIQALRKYGVGSCGPPGFYGTLDVHLNLESTIASYVGLEAAILYSQGFSCVSSVIAAFCKRGDIIIADDAVNFSIQKGIQISRSTIHWYKHNDMADLERVMQLVKAERKGKTIVRQFVIVEGIFLNTGMICPLPEIVALKNKYKYRLLVEESISLGVLGRGKGLAVHYKMPADSTDLVVASFANAFGAAGGFCAGSKDIVEHQRLGGQSYVYSASLPAILAVTAIETIKILQASPKTAEILADNCKLMIGILKKALGNDVRVEGFLGSPVLHLRLPVSSENREEDERFLQDVVDMAYRDNLILCRSKYVLQQEKTAPEPSIRLTISAGFTRKEIEKAATIIRDCFKRVRNRNKSFF